MTLRLFQPADAERLADVYRDSVRTIGPQAYDENQVEAWASGPDEIEGFRTRLSNGVTLVAEENGEAIAFGQFCPPDHLALLYCAGRASRRGVGSLIYDELERRALAMNAGVIRLEASRISRSFFEKKGYETVEVETSVFRGVAFERFRMIKHVSNEQYGDESADSGDRATDSSGW
jgi:putative acetyltransferase